MRKIAELIPYAGNARTHSESQILQIAASIKEFGFINPVIIDKENGIIAGHGRVMAATKLGMGEVPTLLAEHLSDAQRRAYILADNRLALDAGWDDEILRTEIFRLQEENFDLALMGFNEKELNKIMSLQDEGLGDEEETPEAPVTPFSVKGDVWILGDHRIMCGDSTVATDVSKLLGDVKPHLMVTDPPYGVEYDANWRNEASRTSDGMGSKRKLGAGATGKVLNDDKADWREAWALFPGNIAYVWHAGAYAGVVQDSLEACDYKIRAQIIWAKNNFAIGRGDYHWQHEPCWYAVKGTGKWLGDRKQSTLWEIDKPQKSETGHSTQKPVDCMLRPMLNNSSPGHAVYEPFSGSGTSIIAAEKSGRMCYAMELNEAYVDVAILRWMKYSGKEAIHAETGKKFSELVAEREKV